MWLIQIMNSMQPYDRVQVPDINLEPAGCLLQTAKPGCTSHGVMLVLVASCLLPPHLVLLRQDTLACGRAMCIAVH